MSKYETGHPGDGCLLQYNDGELAAGEARRVERHLEACWQCRTELDELRATVADCVRYRQAVLDRYLPPPPRPWVDLYEEFARLDATEAPAALPKRLARAFAGAAQWRWAAAALAAAAILCAVFLQLRKAPSVHAAELLKKAVAIAESQPKAVRHIRIRTRTHQITRLIDGAGVEPALAHRDADAPAIQALFAAAHYDWDDPLSARSFQAWRDSLPSKRDEVTTVADPERPSESCYQIQTAAESGELASASLTLRATDLHPVESRLEFRDREWVELTEIPEPSMSGTPFNEHLEVPGRPASPSLPAATPREPASISDELQVMNALHQIGADLGDPVDVTRSGERVLVSGVGIPPQRQKQIHELLASMPRVDVQFSEPGAVPAPAEPDAGGRTALPASPAAAGSAQARLERQVGGRAEMERIGAQILDWNESAMARAYALRSLAERFPASAEASLKPAGRDTLEGMAREHAAAMLRHVESIDGAMTPMLTALGGSASAARAGKPDGTWQTSAENAFRAARRVEVLLSVVWGATPGDSGAADLPSALLTALQQLKAELEDCQRLLSRNAGG
jgi:anti-sigma factor RsiW